LQFNGDPSHSGWNKLETKLSPSNVAKVSKMFKIQLPAYMDGTPVYIENVSTTKATLDLLLLTTTAGHIVALDAHSGATVWISQHGPGKCFVMNDDDNGPCFTTSSPAVDPNLLYVYTYGLDGYIHKYTIADGSEVVGGGWPQITTTKPYYEKQSSALSTATAKNGFSYLYVTHAAYPNTDDGGDFQGHVTVINLNTSTQVVFNVLCSNISTHLREEPELDCYEVRAGVWGRSGVAYSDITDKIYFTTGNGEFNQTAHHWGDTIVALLPNGECINGDPYDTYTPTDYLDLERHDLDLGSTSPAILQQVPFEFQSKHIAAQSGKDQQLRLVDLENLSSSNGIGKLGGELAVVPVPDYGMVFATPCWWIDSSAPSNAYLFVASISGLSAHRLVLTKNNTLDLELVWKNDLWGSSPLIANDVLYFTSNNSLRALEPRTGKLLWATSDIGVMHWQVPIVVNGIIYIGDNSGALHAYSV
jgi:hypothetical protein